MTTFLWLLVAWGTAFAISIVPAFMPPMWAVLTAFRVGTGVPLVPLAIGGAVGGALGRLVLAELTRWLAPRLPERSRRNAEALGAWFERRSKRRRGAAVAYAAAYTAGPFPGNALFIAAGAGRIPAAPLALGYGLAHLVTDMLWVWVGATAASNARELLSGTFTNWWSLALQLAGVAVILAVFRLPWARWLMRDGGVDE
ncbi:MAG: hypothetical protein IH609_12290 [Dehalococcoidia bacterium]|nr:hypothetical protein [Dehalococcoidia bacterium]